MTTNLKASDLAMMTEDQLGDSLANVRHQIRRARGEELRELQELRERLNDRLDSFVILNLRQIDRDPEIRRQSDLLKDLTLRIQESVREMRTVKKAIDRGVQAIENADKFLQIVLKLAPLPVG